MWQIALYPRTYKHIRNAIDGDIQRREATLRVLYHLSSSEATGAECSDDSIEIGRLSEGICRNVVLEHGDCDRLWRIDNDMGCAILRIDNKYYKKKSIIDGSPEAEDVLNAVWSKYRRTFRSIIRRLGVYFWCVRVCSTFLLR